MNPSTPQPFGVTCMSLGSWEQSGVSKIHRMLFVGSLSTNGSIYPCAIIVGCEDGWHRTLGTTLMRIVPLALGVNPPLLIVHQAPGGLRIGVEDVKSDGTDRMDDT